MNMGLKSCCAVCAAGIIFAGTGAGANNTVRNLAYRRAMYQSSAYNVNETAQLAADGIIGDNSEEANMAYTFEHQYGNESRYGNVQYLFDGDTDTNWETYHTSSWVSVKLPRKTVIKSYSLASGQANWSTQLYAKGWTLEGSTDGEKWSTIDAQSGISFAYNGEEQIFEIPDNTAAYSQYRLNMTAKSDRIYMSEWNMYNESGEPILALYDDNVFEFTSVWMSDGTSDEWIYCDLGAQSEVSGVNVYWGSCYASDYEILISDDAKNWTAATRNTSSVGGTDEITFDKTYSGRYVKLLCHTAADADALGFIVREFEVMGINDLQYSVSEDIEITADAEGNVSLAGGNWSVERASLVNAEADLYADPDAVDDAADDMGVVIASGEYDSSSWLPAVVPGTVLTSYKAAGAVPDPNYADQQLCISDSYFKSNFWYRNVFTVPEDRNGEKIYLNFQAINWKAEVYLNGVRLGTINGAFTRGEFDITDYVNTDGYNYIAVLIYKNTDPGTAYISNNSNPGTMGGVFGNSGSIGRDAPTYSAAAGWDWVPTVRGRNIGIYNEVYLSFADNVKLEDPWIVTKFERAEREPTNSISEEWVGPDEIYNVDPDALNLNKALLTLKTDVENTSGEVVEAVIKGYLTERPDITFEKTVTIPAETTMSVEFDTAEMDNPEIWWPNTYGEQPLYTADITVEIDGKVSDERLLTFGVREVTYHLEEADYTDNNGYNNGDKLAIYCNGVRIIIKGGNWGLEDQDLNVDAEKYDEKIRLQKENNFNMIRNWGGQTNDPEFYNACDRYGILVWDDFFLPGCWLHHPSDIDMFLANAVDKVKNYRYHPSLIMYCGANEMWPESDNYIDNTGYNSIETGLRSIIEEYDGTRTYIPNSAEKPVAVDGPHQAKSPKYYFTNSVAGMMNSERGLPNFPVWETMEKIFPTENLFPQNDMWALHDFALEWNVNGADYLVALENYGEYNTFMEFSKRTQMQSYELHKAMFESVYAVDTNGLLMWMSNPAWTSLMWQSYDYYHDTNGGYYGAKAANQPINYIWNPSDNTMLLHNSTPNAEKLNATVDVFDLNGNMLFTDTKYAELESDSSEILMTLSFPAGATPVKFIRTSVTDEEGNVIARDFYWHNTLNYGEYPNYQDYSSMADMPNAEITAQYVHTGDDDESEQYPYKHYKIYLKNTGDTPAIMVRLKVVGEESGERVLPVYYDDNYFSLMPGEVREITAEFKVSSLGDDTPIFKLEGWNVEEREFYEGTQMLISAPEINRVGSDGDVTLTDGSYSASVTMTAYEETPVDVNLYIGFYKNGELAAYTVKEINETLTESKTFTTEPITLDCGTYDDCEIKAFLWKDNMSPLSDAAVLSSSEMLGETYSDINLALDAKSVIASSSQSAYPPAYAIDGLSNTRWASEYSDEQWLLVDLGEEKEITSFAITWEYAYAAEYMIEVSSDGVNYTEVVHKTNGTGGTETFGFEGLTAQYVRWRGIARATDWDYSIYEFEINNNKTPNLALGAEVSVSSNEYSTTDPQAITDGDLTTRWTSDWTSSSMSDADKNSQWVIIDLGESKTFKTIYLIWEAAYGKSYTIEASDDGENYTTLFDETSGGEGSNKYTLTEPITARYLRINLTQRGTDWGYSLYEVMMYN